MKTISFARAGLTVAVALLAFTSRVEAAPGSFNLSSPANGAWCTATCTFTWNWAISAASYDLYVDSVLKKAAIGTENYTLTSGEALTDGWHTWYIVARDSGGGTMQSASTFSVRVDSTPPAPFALLTPASNAYVPSSPVPVTWSPSSDAGSGLDHYEIWVNGAVATPTVSPSATSASAPLPVTTVFSDPINTGCPNWTLGTLWYCYKVSGDSVVSWGNGCCGSNRSGQFELASPIDLSGVGQAVLSFSYQGLIGSSADYQAMFSDDNGVTWTDVLTLPHGDFQTGWYIANANLPLAGTALAKVGFSAYDNSWAYSWNVDDVAVTGIAAGAYTWNVVAVDIAGNRTVSDTWQVRYDLPPVPFDLSAPPSGTWTANTTPTFTWNATTDAGSGLAKYQLWIDGNLAVDNISAAATTATATSALADGTHPWQVYAVDSAGAVRPSRRTFSIGIDTTPPAAFSLYSPTDQSTSTIPTPTLCWNATTDAGSGLDHYQIFIDGSLNRDGITGTCSTPTATMAQGAHTWSVKAIDVVGNPRDATQTWNISIDFSPPTGFVLLTPANGTTVDGLTPTFTWGASSDPASGLSHYELSIDGVCVACSIPSTSTTYTLTVPLAAGTHTWSVTAVDGVSGSTVATGAPWTFTAQAPAPDLGPEPGLEPRPELGPEPTPEPPHDAGIDAPADSGQDSPVTTATGSGTTTLTSTSTGTATGTAGTGTATSTATYTRTATATTGASTGTVTSTANTGTVTTTGTAVSPEPQHDAAPPIAVADAANPDLAIRADVAASRDGIAMDAMPGAVDTAVITPRLDALGSIASDGGLVFADAAAGGTHEAGVAGRDGGQTGTRDGAGSDSAATTSKASGGCGCVVGGGNTGPTGFWSLLVLGFLVLCRGARPCRRRADRLR